MSIIGLPPGLRGYAAQRNLQSQEQNQQLGQMQGLLGIKAAMDQNAMNAEMMPLKMQQIRAQLAAEENKANIIKGLLGGAGGQVQRDASGQPVTGGISAPGQGDFMSQLRNPETVARLKLAGIDFMDMYKHLDTPRELKPGSTYESRFDGSREFIPKVGEGMIYGQGGVSMAPGYLPALSAITGAQEGAKAGFRFTDLPVPGGTQRVTEEQAAAILRGQTQAPAQVPPQVAPGLVGPDQFPRVPPQVQAQRDADAGRIISRETNGGGIPTNRVVPGSGAGGIGFQASESVKAGDRTMSEGRAKVALDRETKLQQSWGESYGRVQQLDLIENLMADPNVASGALAESISSLKGVADSLGINVKGKTAEDVITAVTGEMALKMRLQGGENLMPGQMSNFEQQLLRSMSPGLAQSREGRMLLIQVGKAKSERDMKISEMAADYIEKNGRIDSGFDRQVREFSRSNPLFAPERIQAMTELAKRLGGRQ